MEEILKTEFSEQFVQMMQNRMVVSYYKYGPLVEAYPHKVDAIESLKARLKKYEETGNLEWLVDVSNFAMIEFMIPKHKQAHFRATDSNESIGRVRLDKQDPHSKNDESLDKLKKKYLREGD
jgi:hypothetical protein